MNFFHATPRKNVASIKQSGLLPQTGVRSTLLGEEVAIIYLFASLQELHDAVMSWFGEQMPEDEPWVVLEVDIPATWKKCEGVYEHCVERVIPPDNIVNIRSIDEYELSALEDPQITF